MPGVHQSTPTQAEGVAEMSKRMDKLETMKRVIEKAYAYYKRELCSECKIREQCHRIIVSPCSLVFLSAVIAGIIDLDGNLIEEADL